MEKIELIAEIFGIIVAAASAIIALFPAPKEGSKYAKFIALVERASIFCATFKKKK